MGQIARTAFTQRFSTDETARHEAESRWKFRYDQWAREYAGDVLGRGDAGPACAGVV